MQRRPQSPSSVRSWWSDSNPGLWGPTLNLHAAARPLSRLLYDRQVRALIKNNQGLLSSKSTIEDYASYFPRDDVWSSTKVAILRELSLRVETQLFEARNVVDSLILAQLPDLLRSPDHELRSSSCTLMASLASWKSSAAAVLAINPCEQVASLLHDGNENVVEAAVYALYAISKWPDGARAVVPHVLDRVLELLDSPNKAPYWKCDLVLNSCLSSGKDEDVNVVIGATCALFKAARTPKGAQATLQAGVLTHLAHLLESNNVDVRLWACRFITNFGSHDMVLPDLLELKPCVLLAYLLRREGDIDVMVAAMSALVNITQPLEGALACVEVEVVTCCIREIPEKLGVMGWKSISGNPIIRLPTQVFSSGFETSISAFFQSHCQIMGNLAFYEATASAILEFELSGYLVALLTWDARSDELITQAIRALTLIARVTEDGARAVFDANVLDHVPELLECPNIRIRTWTCHLVAYLTQYDHERTTALSERLISCMKHEDGDLNEFTAFALYRVTLRRSGAQAALDGKVSDHILKLLESPNAEAKKWRLMSLSQDIDVEIRANAVRALVRISGWPDGATAIGFEDIQKLRKSMDEDVQVQTQKILENLARYRDKRGFWEVKG
ncbi:armadillo-type protein [Mycena capillaripes]|nr:armadillo-type protein [Mycena capillaripes]